MKSFTVDSDAYIIMVNTHRDSYVTKYRMLTSKCLVWCQYVVVLLFHMYNVNFFFHIKFLSSSFKIAWIMFVHLGKNRISNQTRIEWTCYSGGYLLTLLRYLVSKKEIHIQTVQQNKPEVGKRQKIL